MFGEDESESPRVPSPWDELISLPPSPYSRNSPSPDPYGGLQALPTLPPESDSGSIEYKLHLLHPPDSPRFTRLVTQLKWRLLEGGGQAFYELGVADSGVLIGLNRTEMDETLHVLSRMAEQLTAKVVVVKEIEVVEKLEISISSVFKPRPTASWRNSLTDSNSKDSKKREKTYKTKLKQQSGSTTVTDAPVSSAQYPKSCGGKTHSNHPTHSIHTSHRSSRRRNEGRRQARDRRRAERTEKRNLALVEAMEMDGTAKTLVSAFEALHVAVDEPCELPGLKIPSNDDSVIPPISTTITTTITSGPGDLAFEGSSRPIAAGSLTSILNPDLTLEADGNLRDGRSRNCTTGNEGVECIDDIDHSDHKRFIVEALVIRELSSEEAFLDFGFMDGKAEGEGDGYR
ncbi:hypothetical protein BDP27DRAFT_1313771 [Rhodocollybia butyracea]|uniref:GTP-binding protein 2 n=1 Tax=Rhodocollybia butyracea TaxID=206335 RepID=A0A9P5Q5W5_9AGAR|nr:hypothetical protein BDP27DRAFT_1313771 [Rhodocollybia butyracea]